MPISFQRISESMLFSIRNITLYISLTMFVSCSEFNDIQVNSESCWDETKMNVGQDIKGELIAYFSPDNAVTLRNNKCQNQRLLAIFGDDAKSQNYIEQMRIKSTGDWLGGQLYLVRFSGEVTEPNEYFPGVPIEISDFHIVKNVGFDHNSKQPES